MPKLNQNVLELERCPHCSVDRPMLGGRNTFETADHLGLNKRIWAVYACSRCGGVVMAVSGAIGHEVAAIYPPGASVEPAVPDRARAYLQQALDTLHAPAGSVMLSASAVDAMLKAKNYVDGSLYSRIDKAAADHVITADMAAWAHEVRLDANDLRHADKDAGLPATDDARRATDFALALAHLMFVLPARVQRGLKDATSATS